MQKIKKIGRKIREFGENDIVCLVLVIAALGYGLYFVLLSFKGIPNPKNNMLPSTGPFSISMTNIGRNQIYSARYYFWAVLTNIAYLCNAIRMYKRAEVKGIMLKIGQILIIASVVVMFITNWVIEPRSGLREDSPVGFYVHYAAAVIYSILSVGTFVPMFFARIKDKRYIALNCIFLPLMAVTIPLLATSGVTAFAEFYPLALGFILMSIINFTAQFAQNDDKYLIKGAKINPAPAVFSAEPDLQEAAATTEED